MYSNYTSIAFKTSLAGCGQTDDLPPCGLHPARASVHGAAESADAASRAMWNPKPVHDAVTYIEGNPVRRGLMVQPDEYRGSSAGDSAGCARRLRTAQRTWHTRG